MNGDPGDRFFNVLGPTADIRRVCHIIPLLDGILDILCLCGGDSVYGAGQMGSDV